METVRQRIADAVNDGVDRYGEDVDVTLAVVDTPDRRDYTTTVARALADRRGEDPQTFAEQFVEDLAVPDAAEDVAVTESGRINVAVDRSVLCRDIVESVHSIDTGTRDGTVVVEQPALDLTAPVQVDEMRKAVFGDVMARIADAAGYNVHVHAAVNDAGRQPAMAVYAYRNFLDDLSDADRSAADDIRIGVLYAMAERHLKQNVADNRHVNAIIQDIREHDDASTDLRNELVETSIRGQLSTAFRYTVRYDALLFESDIVAAGLYEDAVEQLKGRDAVYEAKNREDKGCIVLDISDYEDVLGELQKPYKILVRRDGTVTYLLKAIARKLWQYGVLDTDVAYAMFTAENERTVWRSGGTTRKQFTDADHVIAVTGTDQEYSQKLVRYGLKALGFAEMFNTFRPVQVDLTYLTEPVSATDRNVTWAGKHGDAVLDSVYERALDAVEERYGDREVSELEQAAEAVTVAAIRYALLTVPCDTDTAFNPAAILDWSGDSGPYLLDTVTRARELLDETNKPGSSTTVESGDAYVLVRMLETHEDAVEDACDRQEPYRIVRHLAALTDQFNTFHDTTIEVADNEHVQRLRPVIAAYVTVMEHGLALLGIDPLHTAADNPIEGVNTDF